MTLDEIAAQINTLFRDYGLDHDVVRVEQATYGDRLAFWNAANRDAMELLLVTLKFVFQRFHEVEPVSDQLRLF